MPEERDQLFDEDLFLGVSEKADVLVALGDVEPALVLLHRQACVHAEVELAFEGGPPVRHFDPDALALVVLL